MLSKREGTTTPILAMFSTPSLTTPTMIRITVLFILGVKRTVVVWSKMSGGKMRCKSHLHILEQPMNIGNGNVVSLVGGSHIHDNRVILFWKTIQDTCHLIRLSNTMTHCNKLIYDSVIFNRQSVMERLPFRRF